MVIWRIVDGRRGHDNQSQGLLNAMAKYASIDCHNLRATDPLSAILAYLLKRFPAGKELSPPDLIIGAGHATHLTVLSAQRACGGKTVVIMKPSLPLSLFDFCLVPDHDRPTPAANVIVTRGAINTMTPATRHEGNHGLIMIGGPSRHFHWDGAEIIKQIEEIAARTKDISWQIADSPRTPATTRQALRQLRPENTVFHSCENTPADWLDKQLHECGQAWVTADSMSMIYESLTAGIATGVLRVPAKGPGKIGRAIAMLEKDGMITRYDDWRARKKLAAPPVILYEADRCARELLNNLI